VRPYNLSSKKRINQPRQAERKGHKQDTCYKMCPNTFSGKVDLREKKYPKTTIIRGFYIVVFWIHKFHFFHTYLSFFYLTFLFLNTYKILSKIHKIILVRFLYGVIIFASCSGDNNEGCAGNRRKATYNPESRGATVKKIKSIIKKHIIKRTDKNFFKAISSFCSTAESHPLRLSGQPLRKNL